MESYDDEIIQEWYTKLRELEEVNQNIKAEGLVLKDLRIRFMFIKKYFEDKTLSKKQKNFLNVKSSSLTALNVMKEKEMMKIKKAYKEIIELEDIEDPFKPKEEKKIKMTEVKRPGVKKPEVNLEEKLRVIRRPREKREDDKKGDDVKKDDEKAVVNEKSIEEKGVSVKSDKKVFVKEKAVEEKGFNKKLVNVKSDKETVVNEKVDNEMLVKEKVDDEKLVNIKRDDDRKRNDEAVVKEADVKGTVDKYESHKKTVNKEKVVKESPVTTNDIKSIEQPVDDIRPIVIYKKPINKNDNPVKLNKNEVKNKMKNLLNAFQSKSQKNGDQNKENIPDHSILVEDGEVKLFIVNKKKRVKDYLKETKRKKNKVEQNEDEIVKREVVSRKEVNKEEVVSNDVKDSEQIKENTPPKEPNAILNLVKAIPNKEVYPLKEGIPFKETNLPKKPSPPKEPNPPQHLNPTTNNPTTNNPTINKPTTIFDRTSELIKKRILKNKTPEKVYDVGTNRFISESNLKNVNLKNLCRSPLKDGLYKNIIDKERKSKSRIGMNKFIPKTPVPEINSDEEENYSGLITEKEISEKLKNQNHEEIEKYFNSELSIDIELLFPNIKEVSNDSPNKWG